MKTFKHPMQILDSLSVTIETKASRAEMNELFQMAARINNKRSFLFVSKVLGKHWPCKPNEFFEKASALAQCYAGAKKLPQSKGGKFYLESKTLFVGFAETATGFAQAVFNAFEGNCVFYHTTRDHLPAKPAVLFQEEHSHATDHFLYLKEEDALKNVEEVVFIDDEFTTGKTVLNIVKELNSQYGIKKFNALAILDWRGETHEMQLKALEAELGIEIDVFSLLRGNINVEGSLDNELREENLSIFSTKESCPKIEVLDLRDYFPNRKIEALEGSQGLQMFDYNSFTGRFGLSVEEQEILEHSCQSCVATLQNHIKGESILFMGFEELIYIPARVAAYYGENARCQSITRSPIYADSQAGYSIQNKVNFKSPKFGTYTNFFYNIDSYDSIVFFFEGDLDSYNLETLKPILERLSCNKVYCVMV